MRKNVAGLLTNVLKEKHHKKRRDQVVDALHIAAGWMAYGPDEKDSLKNLKHTQKWCKRSNFSTGKN